MAELYIPFVLDSPKMNRSTSPVQISPGSFYHLSGVDGRYNGCLRKFYGMKKLVDFDGATMLPAIDTYSGPSFIKAVVFQKKDTVYTYRGFVVRWDSLAPSGSLTDQQIDLVYTLDNGENWAVHSIWATGNGITSSLEIDCDVEGGFLYVFVDTKSPKTIYWDAEEGEAGELVTVYAGPGVFDEALGALTLNTSGVDTDYQLRGNGTYQVAYRFYSSARGIYSALSNPLTVHLNHYKSGSTTEPEEQCKAVIDFPASENGVLNGYDYDDFSELFDTVDVFRTIDLGDSVTSQTGAIFYLEQSIPKEGNWGDSIAWDALQVIIGTVIDEALPFHTVYDPEKDVCLAPPASGTVCRYQRLTFTADAISPDGGYDILNSSAEHISPEYFTTYNRRFGNAKEGRPLRFIPAADSLFALCPNAIIHIYKASQMKPLQFTVLHTNRGLVGKEAVHGAGNSIFMISGLGLVIVSGTDGSMGQISAADSLIFDDWKDSLSTVKSGYDSLLNASLFLCPAEKEILIVWHSLQTISLLEGANFVGLTEMADVTTGKNQRVYLITATGLVVSPDVAKTGSGTMWDLSALYTLNGTATSTGETLIDSNATFHADMTGALLYMTSGTNAGEYREIASVDVGNKTITFTSAFGSVITSGDTYSISPVPFKVRLWPLQVPQLSKFMRWNMTSVSMKVRGPSGFTDNPNNNWRVGAYRNGGSTLQSSTTTIAVSDNPAVSAGHLNIDGITVEPYIEQIAAGVDFELISAEVGTVITRSRKAS